jgi:hypothetical protein
MRVPESPRRVSLVARVSGCGFAVGGFLCGDRSDVGIVFGLEFDIPSSMASPTLSRLHDVAALAGCGWFIYLLLLQAPFSPSSPVSPPWELSHPLQVRILGPEPPAHLTSGEDILALSLQVVAPPWYLARHTDDEATRARDLPGYSEQTAGGINGRRNCDDDHGAIDDSEPIEATQVRTSTGAHAQSVCPA